MLLRDLLWGVCVDLQDHKPQFVRWSARELIRAYNEALTVICRLVPSSCIRLDAIKLQPGCLQSIELLLAANVKPAPGRDLVGIQLLELLCNMGGDGQTPGTAINVVSKKILDTVSPSWQATTGTAVRSLVVDPMMPRHFMVEPAVPSSGGDVWVRAKYTAMPAPITLPPVADSSGWLVDGAEATTVAIGDEYAPDIHAYMVARASMKQTDYADPAKVERFSQVFVGSMNSKVEALTGQNPNLKRLPMAASPLTQAQ